MSSVASQVVFRPQGQEKLSNRVEAFYFDSLNHVVKNYTLYQIFLYRVLESRN